MSGLIGVRDEILTVRTEALPSTQLIVDILLGLSAIPTASLTTVNPSIVVRKLTADDWDAVLRIYGEGIEAGNATFDTAVPEASVFDHRWHPEHRWVAQIGGQVCGWASVSPTSVRDFFSGVVEVSVYVGREALGRGVGKVLLKHLIEHADAAGLWTLQSSIFPDNTASLALHRSAGFRTVGVREKVARLHGVWRDTIIVERRSPTHFQGDYERASR
ncbi:N-acetyltransferase [Hoyosella rhizosphaerae]|uniref:N-acetyltransferase n=1 Tax=Hoyosella rhizosphaerae TaxID=1755582 RepID=A0A916UH45_9ACTN|nr:N-acetyltransferase [Hoyosella rhizosphaerae]